MPAAKILLAARLRRGMDGLGIATKGGTIVDCIPGGQAAMDGLLEPGDEVVLCMGRGWKDGRSDRS